MVPAPHAAPPVAAEQPIITTNPLHEHDDNLLPGAQLPSLPLVGVFMDKKHKTERVSLFYIGIANFNPITTTIVNHTDMCLIRLNGALRWRLRNCCNGQLLLTGLLAGSLLFTHRTTTGPALSSRRNRTGAVSAAPWRPTPGHLPIEHHRELLLVGLHRL
ncbi:hypothetical protein ZWY2020_058231 [Hordeum vulgare]|nr:hypothetical protein ZWY2020_058231 [Hordeum vulgare]